MNVRVLLILLTLMLTGCVSETPSIRGSVNVAVDQQQALVLQMDAAVAPFQLKRMAAKGIQEITSEGTVFYAYGRMSTDRKRPIVLHNLRAKERFEFEIYSQDFDTVRERERFVATVVGILGQYGEVTYTENSDSP